MRQSILPGVFAAAIFAFSITVSSLSAAEKQEHSFAVAIYHFNLQYVAGDRDVEDRIVKESLDPLLDFYFEHPGWKADFEMQGYMVEQMAERFPDILDKMRTLIDRGQIGLISFHYSDQLFLAYPRWDQDVSHRINIKILSENKIGRSGVVFTQEGQYSEGMVDFMENNGFSVAVLPKNLYRYFHKNETPAPYYKLGKTYVVLGGAGAEYEDEKVKVKLDWTFMDDGELLPTKRMTPYSPEFKYKPEAIEEYEKRLKELEKNGTRMVLISEYISKLTEIGVPPAKLLPVPDGDWQPKDTENIFRWMGDYKGAHERDNEVLTRNFAARNRLYALDALIVKLKGRGKGVGELEDKLFETWRNQLLAEVSDSSGWTPMPGEIEYSLELNKKVVKSTGEILNAAKEMLGAEHIRLSFEPGTHDARIETLEQLPEEPEYEEAECPMEVRLEGDFKRKELKCFRVADDRWEVRARFSTTRWYQNDVRLIFPRTIDAFVYSSGLLDDRIVSYPFEDFDLEKEKVYLPAPNGLIGTGKNLFLIKHNETVHVAWEVDTGGKTVALRMLHPPNREYRWVVSIVEGTADAALDVARSTNIFPPVIF